MPNPRTTAAFLVTLGLCTSVSAIAGQLTGSITSSLQALAWSAMGGALMGMGLSMIRHLP